MPFPKEEHHDPPPGAYTIWQKGSDRVVAAFVNQNDFALRTRALKDFNAPDHAFFNGPGWVFTLERDGSYTIQQKSSLRFLDAYQDAQRGWALVTAPAQNDDSQHWILHAFVVEG